MVDFQRLIQEVLRQRVEIDRDLLLRMIDDKKKKVGAGYLTDQGALFLVASDLGVSLDQVTSSDLTLKDLYIGANEITVVGRVFAIYPLKKYVKKSSSEEGQYKRLILFDDDTFAQLTLWDDKAKITSDLGIHPDQVVRVIKGYVKAGLDSRPVLNIGSRGSLQIVDDQKIVDKLCKLKDITRDVSSVKVPETYLSIRGIIISQPKLSGFMKKDGTQGKLIQLYLNSLVSNQRVRVVIWNNNSPSIVNLEPNFDIRLTNLRSRLVNGEIELSGDESTFIEVLSRSSSSPSLTHGKAKISILRIMSLGLPQEVNEKSYSITALATDRVGNLLTIIARNGVGRELHNMKRNDLVECTLLETGSSSVNCQSASIAYLKSEEVANYPDTSKYMYKINKIMDVNLPAFLEVIALSRTTVQNIVTKDGSTVKKAEVIVGDETGELTVVAWRNLTQILEGILPGQRLHLNAMMVQKGRDGNPILQVRSYSSIEKIQ